MLGCICWSSLRWGRHTARFIEWEAEVVDQHDVVWFLSIDCKSCKGMFKNYSEKKLLEFFKFV